MALNRADSPQLALVEDFPAIRARLVAYFAHNGCHDPQNLADEVFSRVLHRLAEGAHVEPSIAAYCWGFARNLLLEYRKARKDVALPSELPDARAAAGDVIDALTLRRCLRLVPESDRALLYQYYCQDREAQARELGMSANALRIRVCRLIRTIRAKLNDSRKDQNS